MIAYHACIDKYTYRNSNGDTDTDGYPYSDTHDVSYVDTYGNSDCDANTNRYPYPDAHGNSN